MDAAQGDVIEVLVVDEELTANREIFLATKIENSTIIYPNRMDFLNSIYDISFFVFTDWTYLGELVDVFSTNLTDHHEISYEINDHVFTYMEEFWNESEVFYNIELQYDILTGALVYQGFIFENLTTSEISIIEINQLQPNQIDSTTLTLDDNQEFSFIIERFETTDLIPVLSTSEGNIWLFEGDIFDITLDKTRHQFNQVEVILRSLDQTISFNNSLASLGSFIVYPDWDYWEEYLNFLISFVDNSTSITYSLDDKVFSVSIMILDNVTDYLYLLEYDKTTGVLNQLSIDSEFILEDNSTNSFELEIKRYSGPKPFGNDTESTTIYTLDTFNPSETNDQSNTPGLAILSSIISLIAVKLIRQKKDSKNKYL